MGLLMFMEKDCISTMYRLHLKFVADKETDSETYEQLEKGNQIERKRTSTQET